MAAIDQYLNNILEATYGEEVRESIHDAILQNYIDVTDTVRQAHEAIEEAEQALADSSTVMSNAQRAVTDANTAVTNANTAVESANTAASNANAKATLADTAAANANTKASLADEKATLANEKATLANTKASLADEKATLANTAAANADAKASLADEKATLANTAASNANEKASLANTAAANANTKASLADEKATLANTAATNANEKASLANTAASNANTKASLADEKAVLASAAATNANGKALLADTAAANANEKASLANTAASNANEKAALADDAAERADEAVSAISDELDKKADILYKSWEGPEAIATIEDGADDIPVNDLVIPLEPVQDLHGYDNPWPAGEGKNLLDLSKVTLYNGVYGLSLSLTDNIFRVYGAASVTGTGAFAILQYADASLSGRNLIVQAHDVTGGTIRDIYGFRSSTEKNVAISINRIEGETVDIKFKITVAETSQTEWTPYSNICPISGRTGVEVTRTGKNVLPNTSSSRTQNGITFTVNGDGSVHVEGTATSIAWMCAGAPRTFIKAGTYTLSGGKTNCALYIVGNYVNGGVINNVTIGGVDVGSGKTFTLTDDANVYYQIQVANGAVIDTVIYPMLAVGSSIAEFAPYSGSTYPITFPTEAGTVYGGQLTVHNDGTGELVVDMAEVDLGALTWIKQEIATLSNYRFTASLRYRGKLDPYWAQGICSIYPVEANVGQNQKDKVCGVAEQRVYVVDTSYETATDFKTAMSGVQLVYELATPITYTLTAPQVRTLLGENHIWSDSGDIQSFVYSSNGDYGKAIDRLDQRINKTQQIITPTEGPTATTNHSVGDIFIMQDKLYKATSVITTGETIAVGTNVVETNILTVISEQIQAALA